MIWYKMFIKMFVFTLSICAAFNAFNLFAKTDSYSFESWIQTEMSNYGMPGASIAIIRDYSIVYANGFGYADVGQKRVVTEKTLFQAASISKPIAATAILMTFQNLGLDINQNINDYLTSWKIPFYQYRTTTPVSLKMLLEHSAGIDISFYAGVPESEKLATLQEALNGLPPSHNCPVIISREPGKEFKYSGGGYLIVQQLIEDMHQGRTFSKIAEDIIFKPLNMENTTFNQHLDKKLVALPYISGGEPYPGGIHQYIEQAVGGIWSNPTDLSKWIIAIQKALTKKNTPLPSFKVAEELVQATISPYRSMGFDVQLDKYGNRADNGSYFMHGGFNPGYLALAIGDTLSGNGAVIMINISPVMGSEDVPEWGFIKAVLHTIADNEEWN